MSKPIEELVKMLLSNVEDKAYSDSEESAKVFKDILAAIDNQESEKVNVLAERYMTLVKLEKL